MSHCKQQYEGLHVLKGFLMFAIKLMQDPQQIEHIPKGSFLNRKPVHVQPQYQFYTHHSGHDDEFSIRPNDQMFNTRHKGILQIQTSDQYAK